MEKASGRPWRPKQEPEFHPCESTLSRRACKRRTAVLLRVRAHPEPEIPAALDRASEGGPPANPPGYTPPIRETRRSPREFGRTRRKRPRRWLTPREWGGDATDCGAAFRLSRDGR